MYLLFSQEFELLLEHLEPTLPLTVEQILGKLILCNEEVQLLLQKMHQIRMRRRIMQFMPQLLRLLPIKADQIFLAQLSSEIEFKPETEPNTRMTRIPMDVA